MVRQPFDECSEVSRSLAVTMICNVDHERANINMIQALRSRALRRLLKSSLALTTSLTSCNMSFQDDSKEVWFEVCGKENLS